MHPAPFLDRLLDDEGLTAGLDEPEAMLLLGALSDRVRDIAAATTDVAAAKRLVDRLCRCGRQLANEVARLPAGENRIEAIRSKLQGLDDRPA